MMGVQGEVGGPLFASEEELVAELAAMSAESAPRRFTLCVVAPERDDAVVVCWGMAFDDEVVAYLPADDPPGRSCLLRLTSPHRVRRMFPRAADMRLVWIDP
jgi:hypothetical protein